MGLAETLAYGQENWQDRQAQQHWSSVLLSEVLVPDREVLGFMSVPGTLNEESKYYPKSLKQSPKAHILCISRVNVESS